jgi:alpha-L-fucosidase
MVLPRERGQQSENSPGVIQSLPEIRGRGSTFLLNVPPDRRGLFTSFDSTALVEFKKLRDENFENTLLKNAVISANVNGKVTKTKWLTDRKAATFVTLKEESDFIEFRWRHLPG